MKADNDKEVVNGEDASKLFERDTMNKDHSKWFFANFKTVMEKHIKDGKGKGVKMQVIFKKPILIRGYGVVSANDYPDRDPKDWSLWCVNSLKAP